MREILGVMGSSGPLTAEENARIEQYRNRLGSKWCHRCDYCQPCPQHIPISNLLVAETFAKRMPVEKARAFVESSFKTAENCEECRKCVERCPYHLDIPVLLKRQRALWDSYLKTGSGDRCCKCANFPLATRPKREGGAVVPTLESRPAVAKRCGTGESVSETVNWASALEALGAPDSLVEGGSRYESGCL